MPDHVLITGGAGFIGSHVADELLRRGHRVRALDSLTPQVHGAERRRPAYLDPQVELVVGDVRDRTCVARALEGVDSVLHLAALVGVGQSMYQVTEYTSVNNLGTSILLEELVKHDRSRLKVRRLVVGSSMSIYGEGLYKDSRELTVAGRSRTIEQLKRGEWDLSSDGGEVLEAVPTPESKQPALESVYALSKYDQECLCLMMGRAYGIPTVSLRFFNVYGPRQALSNPYTGVLATFAARLLNDRAPLIFEDGRQKRDFVSVHDAAKACTLALYAENAGGRVLNIGSGRAETILDVANGMGRALGRLVAPELTGKHRLGDIRHCFADIGAAEKVLGYVPAVSFPAGLAELATFLEGQLPKDYALEARAELDVRGLTL